MDELDKLSTKELEEIVHRGENLHIPTSRASMANRILESRRHEELIAIKKKSKEIDSNQRLTIFYSWQSDLPNNTNRTLIEEALEIAIKQISLDGEIQLLPRLDKDTAGVPGSPNIAATILKKIDNAFLFVPDVSIVYDGKPRPTPNPNVLYELGYAVKSLGVNRVLLVQNTAYGGPEKLPFDLKMNRVITYTLPREGADKPRVKKDLALALQKYIRFALNSYNSIKARKKKEVFEEIRTILSTGKSPIILEDKLRPVIDQTLSELKDTKLYDYNSPKSTDEFRERKEVVEQNLDKLIGIFFELGRWVDQPHLAVVLSQFERVVTIPEPDSYNEIWYNLANYPGLLLFYAFGLGAVYGSNVSALKEVFRVKVYNRVSGKNEPVWLRTNVFNVFRYYKDLFKDDRRYFPGSDDLFGKMKPLFGDLVNEKYEDIFDSFEYLISLNYAVRSGNEHGRFWVPTGSYSWRKRRRKIWEVLGESFNEKGTNWEYFKCFDVDQETLKKAVQDTSDFISEISNGLW